LQKDKDSERLFLWQHCHLTQEPLRRPVVACQLGKLYNKEAVIERLLDKAAEAKESVDHIASIKVSANHPWLTKPGHDRLLALLQDIRELNLTPNPSYSAKNPSVGDGYVDRLVSPWICPVTGLEMNGRFKFVLDWSDGKVLSERAHKMVRDDDAGKISADNLVVLNPAEEEEVRLMRTNMEARQAKGKSDGLSRKGSKRPSTSKGDSAKKAKAAVGDSKQAATKGDKKTVQEDPTTSEVYKSLFSSHSSAQNKPKGNWVTYDPRYN